MFTKETALEKLKEKLGKTPTISERTINEIVDHSFSSFKKEDTTLDDFISFAYPVLDIANKNMNNDVSTRLKTIQKPTEEPKANELPTKSELTMDDIKNAMKEFLNDPFLEIKGDLEKLRNEQQIKDSFSLGIAKFRTFNPDPEHESTVKLAIEDVQNSISPNDTPDSVAEKIKQRYDKITSAFGVSGFKPTKSSEEDSISEKNKILEEIENRVKTKKII